MENQAKPSLTSFRSARIWVEEFGGDIFPTFASLEWFIRKHRKELVRSGQYLPRKGSAGALVGPRIEEVVISIITRECVEEV